MVNTEELRAVLAYIKAHPETWAQDNWASRTPCGTAYCFAGHVAVRAGYHLVGQVAHHPPPGVYDEPARRVAKRILGLTDEEANRLFYCYNTLEGSGAHRRGTVRGGRTRERRLERNRRKRRRIKVMSNQTGTRSTDNPWDPFDPRCGRYAADMDELDDLVSE